MLDRVTRLVRDARHFSARSVNAIMTATYWLIGRHIVEFEQHGEKRADYGQALLTKLSADLTSSFGRGFGVDHLELFRAFYQAYPPQQLLVSAETISESLIRKSDDTTPHPQKSESAIRISAPRDIIESFPLSWTHYVHLLRRSRSPEARHFYETEALRKRLGGKS